MVSEERSSFLTLVSRFFSKKRILLRLRATISGRFILEFSVVLLFRTHDELVDLFIIIFGGKDATRGLVRRTLGVVVTSQDSA